MLGTGPRTSYHIDGGISPGDQVPLSLSQQGDRCRTPPTALHLASCPSLGPEHNTAAPHGGLTAFKPRCPGPAPPARSHNARLPCVSGATGREPAARVAPGPGGVFRMQPSWHLVVRLQVRRPGHRPGLPGASSCRRFISLLGCHVGISPAHMNLICLTVYET